MIGDLELTLREFRGRKEIYDPIRKKYLLFTPEEWVRQQVSQYLILEKDYPIGLISIEKVINLFGLSRRYDIVAYDRNANPKLLIECKSPKISLNDKVWIQASSYNKVLTAQWIAISNGYQIECLNLNNNPNQEINFDFPHFDDIIKE